MLRMNPGHYLVQGSVGELPFRRQSFDLVLCSNLLHHLPDPLAAVAEMRRVSRSYVVLSEPNRNNPAMLALDLLKPEERATLRFTRSLLENFVINAGLTKIASTTTGFVAPNRMPRWLVSLLSRLNKPNRLAAFSIVIGERR